MTIQADYRAAAVDLLTDYAASASIRLQVYRARPKTIRAPCAFVDAMGETLTYTGQLARRAPVLEVVVLHGAFDDGDTVDQRDAFVDGFVAYCASRYHAAGANTLLGLTSAADEPSYVPDWVPQTAQVTYYATRIVLEGLAQS
jgi:hypothetical protein